MRYPIASVVKVREGFGTNENTVVVFFKLEFTYSLGHGVEHITLAVIQITVVNRTTRSLATIADEYQGLVSVLRSHGCSHRHFHRPSALNACRPLKGTGSNRQTVHGHQRR